MDRAKLIDEADRLLIENKLFNWHLQLKEHTGRRLGSCNYRQLQVILNGFYVDHNDEMFVLDSLKHEVAHALTPGHNHDKVWQATAIRLGCKPNNNWKTGVVIPPGRYIAICPCCGAVFYQYRRPKYITGWYCPRCGKERGQLRFSLNPGVRSCQS